MSSTTPLVKVSLGKVQETLLIPLWARARELGESYPLVEDPMAAAIVARIDHDFSAIEKNFGKHRAAFPIRARIFDVGLTYFIKRHPRAIVINLGAGLDTTFFRVDNGEIDWYDLDLPDVIDLRERLVPKHERVFLRRGSMTDTAWMDTIDDAGRPVIIMAAGALFYIPPQQVATMMQALYARFPTAELLFDLYTFVGARYRSVGVRWGAFSDGFIRDWSIPLKIVDEIRYVDVAPDRWSLPVRLTRWLPIVKAFSPRLIHARFGRD